MTISEIIIDWIRRRRRHITLALSGLAVFTGIAVLKPEWVWWFHLTVIRIMQPVMYADLQWCQENIEVCRQVGTRLLPMYPGETPETYSRRIWVTLLTASMVAGLILWGLGRFGRWFVSRRQPDPAGSDT